MNPVTIIENFVSLIAGTLLIGVPGAKEVIAVGIVFERLYRDHYNSLTKEQQEAICKTAKENFDNFRCMSTGVN
jgi:hypothetical protein